MRVGEGSQQFIALRAEETLERALRTFSDELDSREPMWTRAQSSVGVCLGVDVWMYSNIQRCTWRNGSRGPACTLESPDSNVVNQVLWCWG